MGKRQASFMVVLVVTGSSISSSDSSSSGGVVLPVTCNTVEYSLTLDCSSRSTFVRVIMNFVEVLLLQWSFALEVKCCIWVIISGNAWLDLIW